MREIVAELRKVYVPGTKVMLDRMVDEPNKEMVSGLTGVAGGRPLRADRTVTFAAWKPGLLLGDGPELAGARSPRVTIMNRAIPNL